MDDPRNKGQAGNESSALNDENEDASDTDVLRNADPEALVGEQSKDRTPSGRSHPGSENLSGDTDE